MLFEELISCVQTRIKKKKVYASEVKDEEAKKRSFLQKGVYFIWANANDSLFKPDYLVYFAKIKGSFKDAYFRTVKASRLKLEEKMASKRNSKKFVNEFKSNQVFIYCYGMRVLGLNYTINILINFTIFAVVFNSYRANESFGEIYTILKVLSLALIFYVIDLGEAVLSTFSNIKKWTYLNNYHLYEQMNCLPELF
jgi:hypothetical protein